MDTTTGRVLREPRARFRFADDVVAWADVVQEMAAAHERVKVSRVLAESDPCPMPEDARERVALCRDLMALGVRVQVCALQDAGSTWDQGGGLGTLQELEEAGGHITQEARYLLRGLSRHANSGEWPASQWVRGSLETLSRRVRRAADIMESVTLTGVDLARARAGMTHAVARGGR